MGPKSQPLVTGVSPKEGPPGTRVTIRGENLGTEPRDLIGLKICGMDCTYFAEWKSQSKIVARTGPGKGKGDIIVTTRSGGKGSCTVGFRGYFLQSGPLQESAVWIDESQTVRANLDHGRPSTTTTLKEEEDPLGISDEGDRPRMTEEDLLEMFPEASGNMSLENFSPGWYLLENHHNASFEDLKAGLEYMKRRASQRSEGPITVVRSNLTAILDCLDSLTATYQKFAADDIRGDCMDSYAVLLMQAKSCADGLFDEVLGRKDKADSTRNALSVLTKFRFLFHLPLNMQRNIQKGDYNIVINDFEKAKSLFASTDVKIFKKVYDEVENIIAKFSSMLHKRLLDPNNTLDEQKKLISYLTSLECEGDPAWECLDSQKNHLVELLEDCKDDHIETERTALLADAATSHGTPASVSKRKPASASPGAIFAAKGKSDLSAGGWRDRTPQKVMFVEDLTEIMTENFPDFWKLGQAYFSGEFDHTKQIAEKGFKSDTSKHSKLKQMIAELVGLFANFVRAAFLPESLENLPDTEREKFGLWPSTPKAVVAGTWLPHCVRTIRSCVATLAGLDLTGDSMIILQDLAFDLRTNCMFTLLKQAISDVKLLCNKQTWSVETDDESGGTTQLPALFENIVSETVQHLHEVVVLNKPGEPEIFSQRPIQKEATVLCTQLLQAFAHCLEQLAFSPPLHRQQLDNRSSHLPKSVAEREAEMDDDEEHLPSLDKRLIIMLSDCNHTLEVVIPRIIDNLNRHGYVEMHKAAEAAQSTYRVLDERLFDRYIEQKSDPIIGAMEPCMYRGNFSWKTCPAPAGVRNYLKENLMSMIEVHAEVFSISPKFVGRVMEKVTEAVVEEVTRLIHCVHAFGAHGALQARLELMALRETVALYSTKKTDTAFNDALKCIPALSKEGNQMLKDLLTEFKSRMKFQLMCFGAVAVETKTNKGVHSTC
ncbi:exocyst complex component 2-like [Babylonia areolata]|uniref:exocyst complex component 2-like n=1 Tax=Babylonia areolata TaxID=304850 RepID=UPI003FD2E869